MSRYLILLLPRTVLYLYPSVTGMQKLRRRENYKEQFCEVEHGNFLPLVFSYIGSMATIVYKRIALCCLRGMDSITVRPGTGSDVS